MQFNYYFLKGLTKALSDRLINGRVLEIFSQNKNELILCFDTPTEPWVIKANLDGDNSVLSFPQEFARARKNAVNLFKELVGQSVVTVRLFENERSFALEFDDDFLLLFKLHGRQANLVLYNNQEVIALFKNNITKDWAISLDALNRPIDQSDESILRSKFDLKLVYPTFDRNIKDLLSASGFDNTEDDYSKLQILKTVVGQLNEGKYYLTLVNHRPRILLFEPASYLETFDDPVLASNAVARHLFSVTGFDRLKAQLLGKVRKEIKRSESYINQSESKLKEILNRRGHDELANILMANLHETRSHDQKEIELFDFYNNQPLQIKIKPNLSLQQNAEILYRKSKNQSKEIEILKSNISKKQKALGDLRTKETLIASTKDYKALKTLDKSDRTTNAPGPNDIFISLEIDGFEVFIGKNAKNNDRLTQKFARKDDLWLHARDVSGSHVVIRNPLGINIPLSTIEKVAQLAAWNSKRKTDSLCPVIYTPKKYVRKPKGSLPGQVVLSKEQVIMVKPSRSISSSRSGFRND